MSKKTTIGILLASVFILSGIFAVISTNIQSGSVIAPNLNTDLTNSAISVTYPSDLELLAGDPTNHTISWTLTDDHSKDYLGLYSFIDDAAGANPAGWSTTEPVNTTCQVIDSWNGHSKVVELRDDNVNAYQECKMTNSFPAVSQGTIEFWLYGTSSTTELDLFGGGAWRIILVFHLGKHYLRDWVGGSSDPIIISAPGLTTNTWNHFRITFNRAAGTFAFYFNGVNQGTFPWYSTGASIDQVRWWTSALDGNETGIRSFIDAMDYSWTPGYYTNRNMNYGNASLQYAIFDDSVQKTNWQIWSDTVTADYTVSGTALPTGIHNISLVFCDNTGALRHDDVQVTVGTPEIPNIFEVIQTPATPIYPQSVDVTAHITDNNAVQTVLLESNCSAGNYEGAFSFTDDPVGGTPAGWMTTIPSGNNIEVVDSMEGHSKVVLLEATTDEYFDFDHPEHQVTLENFFGPKTSGTIEFWVLPVALGTQALYFYVNGTGYNGAEGYVFAFGLHPDLYWAWCNMGSWSNLGVYATLGTWAHIRMQFDDASRTVQLYINGAHFTESYTYPGLTWTPSSLRFREYGPNQAMYVDAVDYSWAPGYYTNRNMEDLGLTNCSMSLTGGTQQDGNWTYTFDNYPSGKIISYRIFAADNFGTWNVTDYYQFGSIYTIDYYVPTTITIKIDIGKGASRKGDVSFIFTNTGDTNFVNVNFTINIPSGWKANPTVCSVNQLAPGQNVTIKFRLTLPKNVSEVSELVLIDVEAVIPELGITWTIPDPIQVYVNKFKAGDLYIWVVVIIGSISAVATTSYIYVHRRSAGRLAQTTKVKTKNTIALTNALSLDIPGPLSAISVEVMEKIESLPDITPDEKRLLIQYLSQLDEQDALKYLDSLKNI